MTGLKGTHEDLQALKIAEAGLKDVLARTERTSSVCRILVDVLVKVRGLLWVCERSE